MKKIYKYIAVAVALIIGIAFLTKCSDSYLEPDPLSFFEPTKTFTSRKGLESAMASCDKHLRSMYFHWSSSDGAPILTEYILSDLAANGTTDKASTSVAGLNIDVYLTPSRGGGADGVRTKLFWDEGCKGVKYANSIITNIDKIEDMDESLKNEMLGRAYFHRSINYYALIFQFKDIPLLTHEVDEPKFDYRSTKRSVILDMITQDMEFAVNNVPAETDHGGTVTKGACRQLLIKCYLAKGEFDKAIAQADTLINQSGYSLMTEPFGDFINPMPDIHPITRNVIWDLHRPENKMIESNKETILGLVDRYGYEGLYLRLCTMRNCVPFWSSSSDRGIMTPDGKKGMDISTKYFDFRKTYGRGVARMRPTGYAQHGLWLNDTADLRHNTRVGNWMTMEQLKYNHPNLYKENNPYAGKNITLYSDEGKLLCTDTIRSWFDWPHYKVWIEDQDRETQTYYEGGAGDWYMYRLAETYLLRAEAYFWKGNLEKAAEDVNTIRKRAHCEKLFTADEMNMGVIMDERARELYLEEWRHVELGRVSYIFALTGKTDEFGHTYTEDGLSDDSYWWQRVCKYNNYYNSGLKSYSNVEYKISAYHVFYPVPQNSIDGNREGIINQNKGYSGYEYNIEPIDNLEDALAAQD